MNEKPSQATEYSIITLGQGLSTIDLKGKFSFVISQVQLVEFSLNLASLKKSQVIFLK